MLLLDLPEYFDNEFTYPVELSTVLDRSGTVRIEAPDTVDTETIASVIEPIGTESFESADELFETVYGNLSDEYIGRKYYDDRGGNHAGNSEFTDNKDVSF